MRSPRRSAAPEREGHRRSWGRRRSVKRSRTAFERCIVIITRLSLQALVAFTVIAAAFLNPVQPTIAIVAFVCIILVKTGVHSRLPGGLARIFWRDGRGNTAFPVEACTPLLGVMDFDEV